MYRLVFIVVLLIGANGALSQSLDIIEKTSVIPQDVKIIGGDQTTIQNIPYIVAILLNGQQACGGSIIKPDRVLTAAHCLEFTSPSQLSIRAGSTFKSSGGRVVGVQSFIIHPNYNGNNNDIGVMKLSASIPLSSTANVIMLPPQGQNVLDGTMSRVSGWGLTQDGVLDSHSEILRTVQIPTINQNICNQLYNGAITNGMLCAGNLQTGGQDACKMDSGGPLVANDQLIGIVSWGVGCAMKAFPGVYVKVSYYTNWVNSVV